MFYEDVVVDVFGVDFVLGCGCGRVLNLNCFLGCKWDVFDMYNIEGVWVEKCLLGLFFCGDVEFGVNDVDVEIVVF